jgi:peptide/nickel transport system substrate-binding protein
VACRAVWNFMASQAGYNPQDPTSRQVSSAVYASYATNPLWQVVDGPWRLAAFEPDGKATFVPNRRYSGHGKPKISEFVEEPFASQSAEVDALDSGAITVGYVPLSDVTASTKRPTEPGPNLPALTGRDYLVPSYTWSINYFPYNFNSTGDDGNAGKIFRQLYFRQAFQMLVNQNKIIKKAYKGYGFPTYGPVPVFPENRYHAGSKVTNLYRHDRKKAVKLLRQHGWKIVPGGVDTCVRPGTGSRQCGRGIGAGASLAFDVQYASGNSTLAAALASEQSAWAAAGVEITLSAAPASTVVHDATACSAGPSCSWELEDTGTGFTFAPGYLPTGEALFETGSKANDGSYSDPINDNLTQQTNYTAVGLQYYEDYLSEQLPVVFQSSPASYLWEVADNLRGVVPLNSAGYQDPEHYFFVK